MSAILIASSRLCAQIGLAIFLQNGFIRLPMNGSAALRLLLRVHSPAVAGHAESASVL